MQQLIECVPNFSEGRDMGVIKQITDEIEKIEGVKLLDVDPGAATNHTVVTFVGTPPYYWKLDDTYQGSAELTNAGLVVDRTAGIVRGTIGNSASGKTINFKVVVTDSSGKVAVNNNVYTIKVN